MQTDIIISGFGGQGILFAGRLLAYTALDNELHVTWFPSYGSEMRGGTANCNVIISDEEIGSPVVENPQAAIVMNLPSLDKYEPLVVAGGLLVINSSLAVRESERDDIDYILIHANELAEELGDTRLVNMILLGALVKRLPVFSLEAVSASLQKHIPEHQKHILELNLLALQTGSNLAETEVAKARSDFRNNGLKLD